MNNKVKKKLVKGPEKIRMILDREVEISLIKIKLKYLKNWENSEIQVRKSLEKLKEIYEKIIVSEMDKLDRIDALMELKDLREKHENYLKDAEKARENFYEANKGRTGKSELWTIIEEGEQS